MWRASRDDMRWARMQLAAGCTALLLAPVLGCGAGEEPAATAPAEPIADSPAASAALPDEVEVAPGIPDVVEVTEVVEEVVVETEPAQPELAAEAPALPDVAAPPPPAAPAPQARIHTVKRGETLRLIAEHYYGSRDRADEIYQANRSTLSDPNRIRPGQKLAIP